jgi:hypothetical protein
LVDLRLSFKVIANISHRIATEEPTKYTEIVVTTLIQQQARMTKPGDVHTSSNQLNRQVTNRLTELMRELFGQTSAAGFIHLEVFIDKRDMSHG